MQTPRLSPVPSPQSPIPNPMTPDEFNRLKEEEKAHLRQLRGLKQQHRDVQRKASILGALRGMDAGGLAADTGANTDALMRDAATQEARLDLAMEGEADRVQAEADRDATRQASAAEFVRQLKAEAGATAGEQPARPAAADAPDRTIGRRPAAAETPPDAPRDAKTLGRPRGQ